MDVQQVSMTDINWNIYVDDERDFEERAVKDEGEFAIISIGPVNGTEFFKMHIGLHNGEILRSDGLPLLQERLSAEEVQEVRRGVGF